MVKNIDVSEFHNTACIVYPARYPSRRVQPNKDDLHSTILFLGDIDYDLGGTDKESLIDMLKDIETNCFEFVSVHPEFSLFGPDGDIPVLSLETTPRLAEIRQDVEQALGLYDIVSPSEYGYSPHVTVDTETYRMRNIPEWVLLEPAQLWYRGDRDVIGTARRS